MSQPRNDNKTPQPAKKEPGAAPPAVPVPPTPGARAVASLRKKKW